ncbi:uncharacterized protein LOC129589724 isoform X2 [Paramacrobiotus metropolitanus]|uniref:uncharacterized protein LOC129589724 isoform X2 n=1 Tax=Paramacrobiotus metropolitanus TaxID=2943436 RepID=UPI002445E185|nr:uncharacterized protein LOC129589724 isoform X2 [Paramacrobiotus metropolitanus]
MALRLNFGSRYIFLLPTVLLTLYGFLNISAQSSIERVIKEFECRFGNGTQDTENSDQIGQPEITACNITGIPWRRSYTFFPNRFSLLEDDMLGIGGGGVAVSACHKKVGNVTDCPDALSAVLRSPEWQPQGCLRVKLMFWVRFSHTPVITRNPETRYFLQVMVQYSWTTHRPTRQLWGTLGDYAAIFAANALQWQRITVEFDIGELFTLNFLAHHNERSCELDAEAPWTISVDAISGEVVGSGSCAADTGRLKEQHRPDFCNLTFYQETDNGVLPADHVTQDLGRCSVALDDPSSADNEGQTCDYPVCFKWSPLPQIAAPALNCDFDHIQQTSINATLDPCTGWLRSFSLFPYRFEILEERLNASAEVPPNYEASTQFARSNCYVKYLPNSAYLERAVAQLRTERYNPATCQIFRTSFWYRFSGTPVFSGNLEEQYFLDVFVHYSVDKDFDFIPKRPIWGSEQDYENFRPNVWMQACAEYNVFQSEQFTLNFFAHHSNNCIPNDTFIDIDDLRTVVAVADECTTRATTPTTERTLDSSATLPDTTSSTADDTTDATTTEPDTTTSPADDTTDATTTEPHTTTSPADNTTVATTTKPDAATSPADDTTDATTTEPDTTTSPADDTTDATTTEPHTTTSPADNTTVATTTEPDTTTSPANDTTDATTTDPDTTTSPADATTDPPTSEPDTTTSPADDTTDASTTEPDTTTSPADDTTDPPTSEPDTTTSPADDTTDATTPEPDTTTSPADDTTDAPTTEPDTTTAPADDTTDPPTTEPDTTTSPADNTTDSTTNEPDILETTPHSLETSITETSDASSSSVDATASPTVPEYDWLSLDEVTAQKLNCMFGSSQPSGTEGVYWCRNWSRKLPSGKFQFEIVSNTTAPQNFFAISRCSSASTVNFENAEAVLRTPGVYSSEHVTYKLLFKYMLSSSPEFGENYYLDLRISQPEDTDISNSTVLWGNPSHYSHFSTNEWLSATVIFDVTANQTFVLNFVAHHNDRCAPGKRRTVAVDDIFTQQADKSVRTTLATTTAVSTTEIATSPPILCPLPACVNWGSLTEPESVSLNCNFGPSQPSGSQDPYWCRNWETKFRWLRHQFDILQEEAKQVRAISRCSVNTQSTTTAVSRQALLRTPVVGAQQCTIYRMTFRYKLSSAPVFSSDDRRNFFLTSALGNPENPKFPDGLFGAASQTTETSAQTYGKEPVLNFIPRRAIASP